MRDCCYYLLQKYPISSHRFSDLISKKDTRPVSGRVSMQWTLGDSNS